MLKVDGDGVQITLVGQHSQDGTWVMMGVLLVAALAAVVALLFAQTQWALAAIGLLACICFIWRRAYDRPKVISAGTLHAHPFALTIAGRVYHLDKKSMNKEGIVLLTPTGLTVCTLSGRLQLSGFEDAKEAAVLQAVLLGRSIDSKPAAPIRLASNSLEQH